MKGAAMRKMMILCSILCHPASGKDCDHGCYYWRGHGCGHWLTKW